MRAVPSLPYKIVRLSKICQTANVLHTAAARTDFREYLVVIADIHMENTAVKIHRLYVNVYPAALRGAA